MRARIRAAQWALWVAFPLASLVPAPCSSYLVPVPPPTVRLVVSSPALGGLDTRLCDCMRQNRCWLTSVANNLKEMAEKLAYGGHDCEFVEKVSDRFNCQICTKVLRDPHLAVCCGQHFCESCLKKWFTRRGKESCPHCRAVGKAFKHVIHKGLRSEINQLKIRCSNRGEGCQWTGELGELGRHLESANAGCGYVEVACPNNCRITYSRAYSEESLNVFEKSWTIRMIEVAVTMKRKDLEEHLSQCCYLRPYQCEFCGLEDTYEAITGNRCPPSDNDDSDYSDEEEDCYEGHQAECPEVPLRCPNKCESSVIKRKDMKSHRSECPEEPVECPFAEAGCKETPRRCQLENHMSTSLQQHLLVLVMDRKQQKMELETLKADLEETKRKLFEAEAHIPPAEAGTDFDYSANQLKTRGDMLKLPMRWFSEYRRSGKVWHSPPFFYRGGYKMCLRASPDGAEKELAGTYITVTLLHLKGEYDDQIQWPMISCTSHKMKLMTKEGECHFLVCCPLQRQPVGKCLEIDSWHMYCNLARHLDSTRDCLTFKIEYADCYLKVIID